MKENRRKKLTKFKVFVRNGGRIRYARSTVRTFTYMKKFLGGVAIL